MADETFSRVDEADEPRIGPEAVLVCGFSSEEFPAVESLLKAIGAEPHRITPCTEAMLSQRLEDALATTGQDPPVPPDKLPRTMVLSGFREGQVRELMKRYGSTGLARPIFATTTPSNLDFTVRELLVHLLQEHRAMQEREAEASARRRSSD